MNEGVLRRFVDVTLVVEEASEHRANSSLEETHELGERFEVPVARASQKSSLRLWHREGRDSTEFTVSRIKPGVAIIDEALNGSHEETEQLMSAHAEGELRGFARWRVNRHVARCELCSSAYRSFLATLEGLRDLGRSRPAAKPKLAGEVVERIRRDELEPEP